MTNLQNNNVNNVGEYDLNNNDNLLSQLNSCRHWVNCSDENYILSILSHVKKLIYELHKTNKQKKRFKLFYNITKKFFGKLNGNEYTNYRLFFLRVLLTVVLKWLHLRLSSNEKNIIDCFRGELVENTQNDWTKLTESKMVKKANLLALLTFNLKCDEEESTNTVKIKNLKKQLNLKKFKLHTEKFNNLRSELKMHYSKENTKHGTSIQKKKKTPVEMAWSSIINKTSSVSKEIRTINTMLSKEERQKLLFILYGNIMTPYETEDSYWALRYRGRAKYQILNNARMRAKLLKKRNKPHREFIKKLDESFDHKYTLEYFNKEQELCYMKMAEEWKKNPKLYKKLIRRMKRKAKTETVASRTRYGTRIATGASKGKPYSDVYIYTEKRKRNASGLSAAQRNGKRKRSKYAVPLGEDEGSEMHLIEKEIAKYRFLPTGVFYSRVCKSFIANWICESNKKQIKVPFKLFEYGIEGGIVLSIIARFLRVNDHTVVVNVFKEIPYEKKVEMLEMMKVKEDNDDLFVTVISGCKGAEPYITTMNYYVDIKKNKVHGQTKNGRLAGWKRRKVKYASNMSSVYYNQENDFTHRNTLACTSNLENKLENCMIDSAYMSDNLFLLGDKYVNVNNLNEETGMKDRIGMHMGLELGDGVDCARMGNILNSYQSAVVKRPFTPLRKYNLERKKMKYANSAEKLPIGVYFYQGSYVANWWDTNLKKQFKVPFKAIDYGVNKAKQLAVVSRNMRSPNVFEVMEVLKEIEENANITNMDLLEFSVLAVNHLSNKTKNLSPSTTSTDATIGNK